MKNKGFRGESERHVLCAKGISSSPIYFQSNGQRIREDQAASCQDFSCGAAPLGCSNKKYCPGRPEETPDCDCERDNYGFHTNSCALVTGKSNPYKDDDENEANGMKTIEHTAEFKRQAFKRVPKGVYSNLPMLLGVPTTIQVMTGIAFYVGTEIENEHGQWGQDYYISNGEYVIHDGKYHHVYINNKEIAGFESDGIKEDLNKIANKTDKHATTTAKKVSAHLKLTKAETKVLLKKIDVKVKAGAKRTAVIISETIKETKEIKDRATKRLDDNAESTAKDLNKIFEKTRVKKKT